jgi:hypothetical protein
MTLRPPENPGPSIKMINQGGGTMLSFSRLLVAVAFLSLGFKQAARAAHGDTA